MNIGYNAEKQKQNVTPTISAIVRIAPCRGARWADDTKKNKKKKLNE